MKIIKTAIVISILMLTSSASAAMITNGSFDTCDYTGWGKDTDGFGDVSLGNDFEIDGAPSSCRAAINVDYFDPVGDPFGFPISEAFFANTLFQELDFSGSVGSSFELKVGFEVDGEGQSILNGADFIADYFLFGLNDGTGNYFDENGNLGFLIGPTDIDGNMSEEFTFEIDTSFLNQSGWYLDFQLNLGFDNQTGFTDAFGSTLFINNVSLTEIQAPSIPEPSTIAILALGIAALVNRKKLVNC